MSIFGETQTGRPSATSSLRKRLLVTGGATTSALAILVSGCGSSSDNAATGNGAQHKAEGLGRIRYNERTETALRHAINPAMIRAGKRIIAFAGEHPESTTETVGKRAVYLTVNTTSRYRAPEGGPAVTRDVLKLATRRASGGDTPDPDVVLALAVSRFYRSAKHPGNNFYSGIGLYAPGGAKLPVGEDNDHIAGWSAQERMSVGSAAGPDNTKPQYDSSGPQLAGGKSSHDPLSAAKNVAADLPTLIAFTEDDFGPPGRFGDGRTMP
jgi:hypothetical protein